jgi:aspartyl-tRNA(Asn)/glutamyl-tRNA(Gln) amidotransferase subunit A
VKDNIDEAGVVCAAGCAAYLDRRPLADATAVARLRRAGAIAIGRTNMHELADGVTSENPHFGPVHNPWRRGLHPGGSSGGSAVAVAAGIVPFALGTDTGGSVRIPAALTGVIGYKPSRGLVPGTGVLPLSETLDHVGVLGRTLPEVAAVLAVLADDPRLGRAPAPPAGPLRLGVLSGFPVAADPEVEALFVKACDRLRGVGHVVREVRLPGLGSGIAWLSAIYTPELAVVHGARFASCPGGFSPALHADIRRGQRAKPERRAAALSGASDLAAAAAAALDNCDLLVSPTTPRPARPFGSSDSHHYLAYTCPFNLTGQPALSLPLGLVDGLPVGLQLVGRPGGDAALLATARRVQRDLGDVILVPPASAHPGEKERP